MPKEASPFHIGEIEAQQRTGVQEAAASAGGFIRDFMPNQHRSFFSALPFLVVAGADEAGRPWVSILEGEEGFATSPTPQSLIIASSFWQDDPLEASFQNDANIGILGIELATRRRNRLNGRVSNDGGRFIVSVDQSFGNCPQYIREREWYRVKYKSTTGPRISNQLSDAQCDLITAADTFFIGSGFSSSERQGGDGYDASHRGGEPGFVCIDSKGILHIPDYDGNKFFNTIGNLLRDPRVGLLFVDFVSGSILHITGRARINWTAKGSHDPNARRMIEVTVEQVIERPAALALRWRKTVDDQLQLKVVDKVQESTEITSVYLAHKNNIALVPFIAGQYLPVELNIKGQAGTVRRNYSLSGPVNENTYRISVKREDRGLASRLIHDQLRIGDEIVAAKPSGDFLAPSDRSPLVLVSAGVGVTPMLAMLHAALKEKQSRSLWFIHGARSHESHAFQKEVEAIAARLSDFKYQTYYSAPTANGADSDNIYKTGRITADAVLALNAGADAHYMLCGPVPFISDIRSGLEKGGVPMSQVHFESFGPSG